MASRTAYAALTGTEHVKPKGHKDLGESDASKQISVTVILRRQAQRKAPKPPARSSAAFPQVSRETFAGALGYGEKDAKAVIAFAKAHGLEVTETHKARRSIRLRGTVAAINSAFRVRLHDYEGPRGGYHSHQGRVSLPKALAKGVVQCVLGLDTRPIPAKHHARRATTSADPPNTRGLTPLQAASLYEFPPGDGAGQTIGIYEMITGDGPPGYAKADVEATIRAFGGNLSVPSPTDVAIDGTGNSGRSDPETLLDITVAGSVAQRARIAVYFTGESAANITHALQRMIHPESGDPVPTVSQAAVGVDPQCLGASDRHQGVSCGNVAGANRQDAGGHRGADIWHLPVLHDAEQRIRVLGCNRRTVTSRRGGNLQLPGFSPQRTNQAHACALWNPPREFPQRRALRERSDDGSGGHPAGLVVEENLEQIVLVDLIRVDQWRIVDEVVRVLVASVKDTGGVALLGLEAGSDLLRPILVDILGKPVCR